MVGWSTDTGLIFGGFACSSTRRGEMNGGGGKFGFWFSGYIRDGHELRVTKKNVKLATIYLQVIDYLLAMLNVKLNFTAIDHHLLTPIVAFTTSRITTNTIPPPPCGRNTYPIIPFKSPKSL